MEGTAQRSARKPRGEYAKSGLTRAAILSAALKVFAESGYRSGSLKEIAQRVGMSEAGLLHHFRSKSVLLAAVLEHRDDLSYQFVSMDPETPRQSVLGLIDLAAYNVSIPGVVELYCVLSAEATSASHPAHDYFVLRYERTRQSLTGIFAALETQGELQPGISPEGAARATIAMMDGLQVQWLLDRDSVDMAEDLRNFFHKVVTFELRAGQAPDELPAAPEPRPSLL